MSEQISALYFANLMNGREYGDEIAKVEEELAKEHGIVLVFGASDDLMELRGAIHDELGCYDGGIAYLTENGLFSYECEALDDCPHEERRKLNCKQIKAIWNKDWPCWSYETTIPHHTFCIVDDDPEGAYCQGIAFEVRWLKGFQV